MSQNSKDKDANLPANSPFQEKNTLENMLFRVKEMENKITNTTTSTIVGQDKPKVVPIQSTQDKPKIVSDVEKPHDKSLEDVNTPSLWTHLTQKIEDEFAYLYAKLKDSDKEKTSSSYEKQQILDVLASREFLGILMLLLLPILNAIISVYQFYRSTQIWDWTVIIYVIFFIAAPSVIAYVRKVFVIRNRYLEMELGRFKEQIQKEDMSFETQEEKMLVTLNLQGQFIQMYANNKPKDAFFTKERTIALAEVQRIAPATQPERLPFDFKQILESVSNNLAQSELIGILLLFVLPIIFAFLLIGITYFVSGVVTWDYLTWAVTFIIAPAAMTILRQRFNQDTMKLETQIHQFSGELDDHINAHHQTVLQLSLAIHLQNQIIKLECPADKQPILPYADENVMKEIKAKNAELVAQNIQLQTDLRGLKAYTKKIDPNFDTKFNWTARIHEKKPDTESNPKEDTNSK